MKRTERTVNVKAWGRLGAKRVVLYEDRDELRFTDGFHDMRMTQARMEAFVPGGDAVLADVYRRVRGTRSWHPVVKELKKLLDERGGEAYEDWTEKRIGQRRLAVYAVGGQCASRKRRMGKGALPGMRSVLLEKTGGCRCDLS